MSSLAELKKEAEALQLKVSLSGRRPAKEDYLRVLRAYHLVQDYPDGPPYQELVPMLCHDLSKLRPREQDRVWTDSNWIVQPKFNGCRVVLHFVKGVGVFGHSRNISTQTYRRTELTAYLPFAGFVPAFTATADSEAVCSKLIDTRPFTSSGGEITRSQLQSTAALLRMNPEASKRLQSEQNAPLLFHVFDLVHWNGADLRGKYLYERLALLADFRLAIEKAGFGKHVKFVDNTFLDKRKFYEKVLTDGGEGVILKNLYSSYIDSTSRSRHAWLKVKREVELTAYVSGFEPGRSGSKWERYIACLCFSVKTGSGHRLIAKVSNLPWDFRKANSLYDQDTGKVRMNTDVYGRVGQIAGQELSARAFRLTHPRLSFWRKDLDQDKCLYDLNDLQAVREGSTSTVLARVTNSS